MDRELRPDERAALDALLSIDFPGVAQLRIQARDARAGISCTCGCPTITLVSTASAPIAPVKQSVPVEGYYETATGEVDALLLLLVTDGRLAELEYAPMGEVIPTTFPPAQRLGGIQPSP
jgi:hypothetical protein